MAQEAWDFRLDELGGDRCFSVNLFSQKHLSPSHRCTELSPPRTMIDRKLEANIKKTKEFIEIWNKFHRIFKNALVQNALNKEEEKNFLSTRTLVHSRYDDLMDSLGVKPIKRFIESEFIYNILSLENLSFISDERLKTVHKDWNDSSKFLGALLARLEKKKRRIKGFNRLFFMLKQRRQKR